MVFLADNIGVREAHMEALSRSAQYIEGIDHGESEALLDRLWAHATRAEFTWTHSWTPGDLLVWSNRYAMHHRTPIDETRRRVMLRTQFQGDAPQAG